MSPADLVPNVPLRPNQKVAVESRGKNQLVLGGAGSGKTRAIVHRYLSLLEQGLALSSIVVITFDEQAAEALRTDIRREIDRRTTATTPRDTAKWIECLDTFDRARIGTIHSLCETLLRENPVEAVVDPCFQTIGGDVALVWQDQAVRQVLDELKVTGASSLPLLRNYRIETIRENLRALLALGAAPVEAFSSLPASRDALILAWSNRLARAQREGLAKLIANPSFRRSADWISGNAAQDTHDKLEKVRAEYAEHLARVRGVDAALAFEGLKQIADSKIGNVGSKRAWLDVLAAREHIFSIRFIVREFVEKHDLVVGPDDERAAGLVYCWRDLWSRARAKYSAHKASEHVLDAEDLTQRALALVTDHSRIRELYHSQISALLVDEFQEVSPTQRDVIYALAAPSEPDRLFIAADPRQSIYRLRGAEVAIVSETERDLMARWGPDARILLGESLRQHNRLAQAMNHIFSRIMAFQETAPFEPPYIPVSAPRASTQREPVLEIAEVPSETIEHGKLTESDRREWQAREIAACLARMHEQFTVWDDQTACERPAQWGDMALLFHSPHFIPVYEGALESAHVPFASWIDPDWFRRSEVSDLCQLLRALAEPLDNLALACVLRSPFYAQSDETLYRLRQDGAPLWQALANIPDGVTADERAQLEFAQASLAGLQKLASRVPVLDLLRRAVNETGLTTTLSSLEDGERRTLNVERFLDLARQAGDMDLNQFIAYLDSLSAAGHALIRKPSRPLDAVHLLTIQQAKGLEFPIVVIPEASQPIRRSVPVLYADKETGVAVAIENEAAGLIEPASFRLVKREAERRDIAEEKRLLYVAATRAKEYLFICGETKPRETTFLGQILSALDGETVFDWGQVQIRAPSVPLARGKDEEASERAFLPGPSEEAGGSEESPEELPPLTLPLQTLTPQDIRTLSLQELQTLVSDPAEFERTVMQGGLARVPRMILQPGSGHAPVEVVDEITRRALLHWRLPDTCPDLLKILEAYASTVGCLDPEEIQAAVHEARALLFKFQSSDLGREMTSAIVRRLNVPFVTTWEGRSSHGTLDALYQAATGRWFIADFKTDRLGKRRKDARAFTISAYGVQVGIRQAAAIPQWGQVPVRIHYLREDLTIIIYPGELVDVLKSAAASITTS